MRRSRRPLPRPTQENPRREVPSTATDHDEVGVVLTRDIHEDLGRIALA